MHKQTMAQGIVTEADFEAVDFERPAIEAHGIADWRLGSAYMTAYRQAEAAGHEQDTRVFSLLAELCQMHLKPEDPGEVWGPMMSGGGGRSAIPEDFKGEQSTVLQNLLAKVQHPSLRARMADVVWTNDRSARGAASVAIDSYCECVDGIVAGRFDPELPQERHASIAASEAIHRALQIAQATAKKAPGRKKAELPDRVVTTLRTLYDQAKADKALVVFGRTAELGLYYEIFQPVEVAQDAEAIAASATDPYPMALKSTWDLGVRQYRRVGDKEGQRRCQLGALEQILAMRKQVSSAGAEAHWVSIALQAIEHIDGLEEREDELLRELRRLQRKALKEFTTLSVPLEIGEERDRILKGFDELDLPAALLRFALITESREVGELKAEALEALKTSPIASMIGGVHVDGEGKFIVSTPGADGRTEPDEAWFRREIDRGEDYRRQRAVAAAIDPVRMLLHGKYNIGERHLAPIFGRSPFVPASQEPIFVLGFVRFFQGDFMSAAHLIIPQLEPCLRHILKLAGHDPARRFTDATEEDHDIGGLLKHLRTELEQIFNSATVAEIDALFHSKPGPALRHEMAHGHVGAGACFHHSVIYATWLLYRLCCLFIVCDWATIVGPAIDAEG